LWLCPSSGFLNSQNTQRFGNWIHFRLQMKEGRDLLCWAPWRET
jgi:hypothetical protein